ncbi:unnamed protein product [Paramecium primaurelia]|uniref:Transmembrane protein n=1 Tax=Paramecium primaurelia TaxID=5886 RepID=A0A8S1N4X9_PARPR|nr:unnamed protein product [Paramecium primaurelia]
MYIILILLYFVKSQEIINLEIDKSYTFYGEVPNSWLSYPVYHYKLEIPQEKDVFVLLLKYNDTRENHKLFMKDNKIEQIYEAQDCKINHLIMCKIESTKQIQNITYYFIVFCKYNCHYELKVMTENKDFYLNEGIMIKQFEVDNIQPLKINLTNIQYERLYIMIKDLSYFGYIPMYITINEKNPINYEFNLESLTEEDGYLFLQKNYTYPQNDLTLFINKTDFFLLELKTYQIIQEIVLYEKLYDQIIKDRVNYYKLIIDNFNENILIFEVIPLTYKVSIYIQPCIENRCEIDFTEFEWQYQFDQGYNYYAIPPYKMIYTKVYLIAINTKKHEMLDYILQVKLNQKIREIPMYPKVYEGILLKNQIALYLLDDFGSFEQVNIKIQANFPKGHGVILSKQCIKDYEEMEIVDDIFEYLQKADINNYYNCSITPQNASSFDKFQSYNNLIFYIDNNESKTNVTKFWIESQSFNFHYVIAIYSQVDFMRFSLKFQMMISQQNHIKINKFIIYYNQLQELTTQNYTNFIEKQQDLQIYFITAAYQGESNILYQKNNIHSYYQENKLTTQKIEIIQYINEESNSYKIQIDAITYLKYSIILILKSKLDTEIQYIPLTLANPFKTIDLDLYFSFEITEPNILYINLKSLQGNFICYILSSDRNIGNKSPNESNLTLTSMSHTLIIENPKQFYYLYVKSTSLQENESYQIMYYHKSSFLELFFANTFYSLLNDQQTLYYYYQSFQNHKQLYIILTYQTEQNDDNNLQIYISFINKYPDQFNFQYQIQPKINYIVIPNYNFEAIIYIGVYSKGSNKYSLLIQEQDFKIELKDNIIQTSPNIDQQYYYFYYMIPKNFIYPIKIQAHTKFNLIELLCNIVEYDSKIDIEKLKYPTNNNYEIKELFSESQSNKLLFINQTKLIKCKNNGCLLLINVYVLGHFNYFNIMVSSKYTVIRNLEMILGYANNKTMSYYYFEIFKQIKDIQITVRTIQICNSIIYVQKSKLQGEILYPTIDKYTYKFSLDTFTISEEDNIGQYVIGVLAEDCIFEVLLHIGGFQLHYIHNGQLIETYINENVSCYYLNNHQESFRIMIYNIKNIMVSIRIENKSEIIELTNNSDLFGGIIQIDKDLCSSCTYILSLQPIRPTILSLLFTYNNIPLSISYGRIYYDHCLNTCEFNLKPGELNLFVYSKSIKLTFRSQINRLIQMDLTYSNHIIPINESCILQIRNDSYYSINLNNQYNPIILQLGRVFNGRNTISHNTTLFIFKIDRIQQEYIIQVSSQSDFIIDIYYQSIGDSNKLKIIPKSEFILNKSKKTLIYQFQQIEQPYQIILQSIDDYHIFVDVYNQNQFKYINFNNHYIEIIQETQQYNIQAIQEQELQIEKLDCLGKTQMQKLSLATQKDIIIKIQVTDRPYPYPFNIFSLVPHIQYSHDQWYIKNSRFEIYKLSDQQLEVTINTMKRKKTGSLSLNKLIYKMHLSNQENIIRALGCEIDIKFLQKYSDNDNSLYYNTSILEVEEKQESIKFIVLINKEYIYGQVIFQAYYENYNVPYTYFYNTTLIYNETDERKIKIKDDLEIEEQQMDYIFIVIGISVILGIGLICLWVFIPKQKQKKRELNEEQQQQYQQEYLQQYQQELQQLKEKEQELVKIN